MTKFVVLRAIRAARNALVCVIALTEAVGIISPASCPALRVSACHRCCSLAVTPQPALSALDKLDCGLLKNRHQLINPPYPVRLGCHSFVCLFRGIVAVSTSPRLSDSVSRLIYLSKTSHLSYETPLPRTPSFRSVGVW